MSSSFFTAIDGGDPEIISCGGGMPTGGGAGGNTDRQEGQKDFVSHNKVFVDLSSDTGILLRVFAAVVSCHAPPDRCILKIDIFQPFEVDILIWYQKVNSKHQEPPSHMIPVSKYTHLFMVSSAGCHATPDR